MSMLVLFLSFFALAADSLALDGKALRHYEAAVKLSQAGRLKDAKLEMDVALALAPEDALVTASLAKLDQGLNLEDFQKQTDTPGLKRNLISEKAHQLSEKGRNAYKLSEMEQAAQW